MKWQMVAAYRDPFPHHPAEVGPNADRPGRMET